MTRSIHAKKTFAVRGSYIYGIRPSSVEATRTPSRNRMRFVPLIPTILMMPALFQMQGTGTSARTETPIENDARDFMAGYAEDLRRGRRQSIVNRYDKRGAYRVGEGEKTLESWELIRAAYLSQWNPPTRFTWRESFIRADWTRRSDRRRAVRLGPRRWTNSFLFLYRTTRETGWRAAHQTRGRVDESTRARHAQRNSGETLVARPDLIDGPVVT